MSEARVVAAAALEPLLELLCRRLQEERKRLADPFRPQRVLVGSRGMMRWLRAQLATRGGACINIEFDYLASGLARAFAPEEPVATLTVEHLALLLLRLVEQDHDSREWFHSLLQKPFGGGQPVDDRALGLATMIAELLDRLLVYRPQQAPRWLEQKDTAGPAGRLNTEQARLVARLWAECRRLHQQGVASHLFQLHQQAAVTRHASSGQPRLHLFGVAALPPLHFEMLMELLEHDLARLYLLAPAGNQATGRDPDRHAPANLLGRLSEDFVEKLSQRLASLGREPEWLSVSPPPSSLLGALQAAVRGDDSAAVAGAPAHDYSVQFHGCHGPTRQVEVLKDRLLDLFAREPDLEPRQVIVMTPDVELYGPLVQAVFSQPAGPGGEGRIPVQLLDRSALSANRFAATMASLLHLASGRVQAPELLELLSAQPVQRRFGLSPTQLALARELVRDSGIRWALDEDERAACDQPADEQNTVLFGTTRLASGLVAGPVWPLALGERHVAPLGGIEGERAELAGRLLRFFRLLEWAVAELRRPRGLPQWCRLLGEILDTFCLADPDDRKQQFEYRAVLERIAALERMAALSGLAAPLEGHAILELLGRAPAAADLAGTNAVAVCSFQPMRAVPFRVVCLLGMDDGAFPRRGHLAGAELFAEEAGHRCCDRPDPRAEDLEVFLETVLAARRNLVVCYSARDPHSNEPRHPAGPVELLLETTAARTGKSKDELITQHPLQPFSPTCFSGDESGRSFCSWAFRAARELAATHSADKQQPLLFSAAESLPPPDWLRAGRPTIAIDELIDFFKHPARHLLKKRLGIYLSEAADALPDREPVELDNLEAWNLGKDILERLSRTPPPSPDELVAIHRARGTAPLGRAGRELVLDYHQRLQDLATLVNKLPRRNLDIDTTVTIESWPSPAATPLAVRLQGSIAVIDAEPEKATVFELVHDSPQKPKNLLALVVKTLAARQSGSAVAGAAIGIDDNKIKRVHLQPELLTSPTLARLVELYLEGLCRPLPLPPKSAHANATGKSAFREYFKEYGDQDEYWNTLFPETAPILMKEFADLSREIWTQIGQGEALQITTLQAVDA